MTTTPAETERWIRIDAAAAGLDVGVKRAYQLADLDGWRRTGGKPTRYALSDVRATHRRRAAEQAAAADLAEALDSCPRMH
jgi:hypothetical protein